MQEGTETKHVAKVTLAVLIKPVAHDSERSKCNGNKSSSSNQSVTKSMKLDLFLEASYGGSLIECIDEWQCT